MRPKMKLMLARAFISGAGLSYCCIYMMLGQYENQITFVDCCFFLFSCAESRETFMTYLESFISGDIVTRVHASMSFMLALM